MQLGKYQEAEKAFKQAIKNQEDFSNAYVNLARLYIYLNKNLDEALRLINQAIKTNPTADSYDVLASIYAQKGMRAQAMEAIDKAIQLAPESEKEFYSSRKEELQKP